MYIQNLLINWRNQGYHLNYGDDCIRQFVLKESNPSITKVLDLGCGNGRDLKSIQAELSSSDVELFGIGSSEIEGVQTIDLDLECELIPYMDNCFDLTICNQVFEHLKNWLWVFHEQIRVTKVGGAAIVGFPNLAALHCRIQLMFGKHPSCIKIDSAHFRGFTRADFTRVIDQIHGIKIIDFSGSNMYGFPPQLARVFGKRFPEFAVAIFFMIRKTHDNVDVIKIWRDQPMETNYFTGL